MARVTFPTCHAFLLSGLKAASERRGEATATGELSIPHRPAGGRFPAVIISQGLGGPKKERECAYGAFLARLGFVSLTLDSFASRHTGWMKDDIRALIVTEAMMVADAYAALEFLASHPSVDPSRIYLFGFSYGGMVSVLSSYRSLAEKLAPKGERFAGHVSYYGCSIPRMEDHATTGAPVLMILGENDRNVSIPRTEAIARDLRSGGSAVDLEILPQTYHQWDGADVTRRHVKYNLRHCAVRIDKDCEIYDEATGKHINGTLSRALFLWRRSDREGYDILRDEEATRHTDRRLVEFLGGDPQAAAQAIEEHIGTSRP